MPDVTLPDLTAGASISDSDIFIARQGADTEDNKVTASQIHAYTRDLNGETLIMDADSDTQIRSNNDDDLEFLTGGSIRMQLNNSYVQTYRPIQVNYGGDNSLIPFDVDASNASLTTKPVFVCRLPTSANKAFQFTYGSSTTAWMSCEIDVGGSVGKSGFALGSSGSSRDTNLYREGANHLRTDDHFQAASIEADDGATGSFTTSDGKTVTVTNGIITNIV